MENNLTELQNKILDLRTKKGYTVDQTLKSLDIKRSAFNKEVQILKDKNLYDEDTIKKAMKRKKQRENKENNKNKVKLPPQEEEYRKKCIDFLAKEYFNYNNTHHINPLLIKKIKELHEHGSYQLIFFTIISEKENLAYASTKNMSSEYNTISYMMAIIRNNLNKSREKLKLQQKINQGMAKKYNDTSTINDLNNQITTKPTTRIDMSDLIDD